MKFLVTPELVRVLKSLRAGHDVSSKDLAEHLGKSPSYVSKLEKGNIRRIEQEILTETLLFITRSDDFYGQTLPAAMAALSGLSDENKPFDQVWFVQYDIVDRPVTLPSGMAADMSDHLRKTGISVESLVDLMNANIDSQAPSSFPANQMTLVDYDGAPRMLARLSLTADEVGGVLDGRIETVRYFVLYGIVHTLLREGQFPKVREKLPPDKAVSVLQGTAAYMEKWGVHSLTGYSHFLASDEFISHQLPLSTSGQDVIDRLADQLRDIFAYDPLRAISSLNALRETLEWDPAFALKIMGIPFADLGETSYANKRALLEDIQQAFDSRDRMNEFERKMENY